MAASRDKTIMRSLGEFVGHIVSGIRANPTRHVVKHETEEAERGNLVLRRTTIEEIEVRPPSASDESSRAPSPSASHHPPPPPPPPPTST
ncbi:MAG: hypothetical protein HKO59_12785 [Phycisphaerales bacterium]|nr:hypothetical protein [Phycisphaerales bacterium]